MSRPARGAWIEIPRPCSNPWATTRSRPARGAWIEIESMRAIGFDAAVAPRTGRVD